MNIPFTCIPTGCSFTPQLLRDYPARLGLINLSPQRCEKGESRTGYCKTTSQRWSAEGGDRSICLIFEKLKCNNIMHWNYNVHRRTMCNAGKLVLIISFDFLREKIFTTIDLIHTCIKIRFQNCHWLPKTAPQNFQRMLHFDAIQIKKRWVTHGGNKTELKQL